MAVEHHRLAVMQRGWAGWDTFSYAVARVKAQLVAEDDEAAALRQENQELQVRRSQPTHPSMDMSGSRGLSFTHPSASLALRCSSQQAFFVHPSRLSSTCQVPPSTHLTLRCLHRGAGGARAGASRDGSGDRSGTGGARADV